MTVGSERFTQNATSFACMRRALCAVRTTRTVAVFISTAGTLFPVMPVMSIQNGLLLPRAPYSDLGFDQLAEVVTEDSKTIEEVSTVEFMVKLGRPL